MKRRYTANSDWTMLNNDMSITMTGSTIDLISNEDQIVNNVWIAERKTDMAVYTREGTLNNGQSSLMQKPS